MLSPISRFLRATRAPRATARAAALLGFALLAGGLPAYASDDETCQFDLGRGWPPATENYGSAVEQLLAGDASPALMLTRLPAYGAESGLQLVAGAGEGDWSLRFSRPDQPRDAGAGAQRELRMDQQPDVQEVPMPAALAARVVADWKRVLASLVPADRPATFHDDHTALLVIDGERVSGVVPDCGPGALLGEQLALMIAATDDGENKRAKRWTRLAQSLDELEQSLGPAAAGLAGENHGND